MWSLSKQPYPYPDAQDQVKRLLHQFGAQRLIEVTYEALMRGIAAVRPGATTGDIGAAIQSYAEPERFRPERTLFVDDSIPVLDAARGFGITWLRAVRLPDSGRPAQDTGSHAGIDRVADLM